MTAQLQFEDEPVFIDPEEDDEAPRTWWSVKACPSSDACSQVSWKKAQCWSYLSEEVACRRVQDHLMRSGFHNMNEDDAFVLSQACEVEEHVETYQERAQYAKQCSMQKEKEKEQQEAEKGKGKKKGSKGKDGKGKSKEGKGKDVVGFGKGYPVGGSGSTLAIGAKRPRLESQPAETTGLTEKFDKLADVICSLATAVVDSKASSSSSTGQGQEQAVSVGGTKLVGSESVSIPLKEAQRLFDSLSRAHYSMSQTKFLAENVAKQLADEMQVVDRARDGLKGSVLNATGVVLTDAFTPFRQHV